VSRLKITETFVSIQGEADAVGWPTLFIRLTGCPLRCVYCDTQYSFYGGGDTDALPKSRGERRAARLCHGWRIARAEGVPELLAAV
jgi:7-carboxy-7-deazaguanine synthase